MSLTFLAPSFRCCLIPFKTSKNRLAFGIRCPVRAVVAGEIVRRNDELLLHVELIGVDDGAQLWGAQFRGLCSEVVASPEKLADSVSSGLQTILAPSACRRRDVRTKVA